jgi:hypothetical protein
MADYKKQTKRRGFLLHLVRSALWKEEFASFEMPSNAVRSLFRLAKEQTVEGLVSESLMRNNVRLPKEDAFQVYKINRDVTESNAIINKALSELCVLLTENHVKFVVVKGQTIAALYRVPEMRTPGDIDFYCDEQNFQKAKDVIAKNWHVEYEDDTESEQHVAFSYKDVTFELHFCLMKFASPSNQRKFDAYMKESQWDKISIGDVEVPILSPELNILYTFLHLYHHLIELGVSIRQFCDLAVLADHLQIRKDLLETMLNDIGFMRAFKTVGCILVDYLGLPKEKFPFQLSRKDRKHIGYMFDIIFEHGNFGMHRRKYEMRSGLGYYMDSFKTKLSHYWHLYKLSPKECRAVLALDVPKKILQAVKR